MALDYAGNTIEKSPGWLLGPYGQAWLLAMASGKDFISQAVRDAIACRMPLVAPPDALPLIGEERGLPRGPGESAAGYAVRLTQALVSWQWAGTPYGLLTAMYLAGFPTVRVQCQSGKQFTLNGVTGNVDVDLASSWMAAPVDLGGVPKRWSDVAVLIAKPWPAAWGGTPPADGSLDCQTAQAVIRAWKGAVNRCVKLACIDGPVWGAVNWNAFNWGGGSYTNWTPPAG